MNRIPPTLLYLTIYNPTLVPTGPIEGDNEDAEEQAHILFYTSKERAVSRDRMLRQIGLAKALINFAESFSMNDTCDNVHSQSKRMIMVSPEPNFWIHAGVEVAKVPRNVDPKNKPKTKGKPGEKVKENETNPLYDYEDGSVHDNALQACILQGYEKFKLTHGSFTSILSTLGQQALELQLERFWTVWGWSWNLDEKMLFGEQFGPLLHPLFSSLVPLVDEFSEHLSYEITPVVLSRQHIIPSGRYTEGRFTSVLATHLSSMIPPPMEPSRSSDTLNTLASSVDTIKGKRTLEVSAKGTASHTHTHDGGTFLGIPAMNMNMDMKKWNWPGYLTFGKGDKSKPSSDKSPVPTTAKEKEAPPAMPEEQEESRLQAEVNASDLEDAISSNSVSTSGVRNGQDTSGVKDAHASTGSIQIDAFETPSDAISPDNDITTDPSSLTTSDPAEDLVPSSPSPPPLPEFSLTRLNLAPPDDPTNTRKTTIHYLIKDQFMLALIDMHDCASERPEAEATDLQIAAERANQLFDGLEATIYDHSFRSASNSLPSANKILQTADRYLMSTAHYTHASPGFASTSSHLFNAKATLDLDPEITEVFSRGQNPQHWHIAKRGLSNFQNTDIDNIGSEEAVFMEIFRKETSLTDVDNVLTGVVKKSGLVDGSGVLRI